MRINTFEIMLWHNVMLRPPPPDNANPPMKFTKCKMQAFKNNPSTHISKIVNASQPAGLHQGHVSSDLQTYIALNQ